MNEFKILKNDDLELLESEINQFLFLMDWLDRDVKYFKIYNDGTENIAFMLFEPIQMTSSDYTIRKYTKVERIKNNPQLKEKINKYIEKFIPDEKKENVKVMAE